MKLRSLTTVIAALATAASLTLAPGAAAAPASLSAPARVADPPEVPDEFPMAHLRQFQTIASNNGGTRAHGRPGYRASVDFVSSKLTAAGFQVNVQSFSYNGATGWNVIADWPHGDPNQVIFLGAHLDSVTAGPGINDNASGSGAVLEAALTAARSGLRPAKRLRFGWWGAEELGLIGSRYYTDRLPSADRAKIKAYLNFDMVGARNTTTWGVYNDNAALRSVFEAYFRREGVPTRPVSIGGRSDHASFSRLGIPVSGIASGNDPCYHQPCDTINNVGANVEGTSTNASIYAAWTLAGDDTGGTVVWSDDLETDKGWQVNPAGTDTATSGRFERGDPAATTYNGATYQQGATSSGANALVTGAAGGEVGAADLDGGVTSVQSPAITLPSSGTLTLSLQHYLAHLNNATSADYLRIKAVTSSAVTTVLSKTGSAANLSATWQTGTADLTAYAGQTIRLLIEAADNDTGSLIETAVDDIKITSS